MAQMEISTEDLLKAYEQQIADLNRQNTMLNLAVQNLGAENDELKAKLTALTENTKQPAEKAAETPDTGWTPLSTN